MSLKYSLMQLACVRTGIFFRRQDYIALAWHLNGIALCFGAHMLCYSSHVNTMGAMRHLNGARIIAPQRHAPLQWRGIMYYTDGHA